MKHRLLWIVSLIVLLLVPSAFALAQNATGTVTAGALNLRAQPTLTAPVITQLPNGARVGVVGRTESFTWYYVSTGSGAGWVSGAYLRVDFPQNVPVLQTTPPPPVHPSPTPVPPVHFDVIAVVNTGALNVRSVPSGFNNHPIGRLQRNDQVVVVGRTADNGWYQIQFGTGLGWIDGDFTYLLQGSLSSVPVTNGGVTPPPVATTRGYVNTGALNIRSVPDWRYNMPLTFVFRNTSMTLIGRTADSEWYQIQLDSGLIGWVRGRYLTVSQGNVFNLPVTG